MSQLLPETGLLRLSQIIGRRATKRRPALPAIIPVSRTTWYDGIKAGRFPKPVALGPMSVAWRAEDIRRLIEQGTEASPADAPAEQADAQ